MRFHYPNIQIDELNDEAWIKLYNEYVYVMNRKNADLELVLQTVIERFFPRIK